MNNERNLDSSITVDSIRPRRAAVKSDCQLESALQLQLDVDSKPNIIRQMDSLLGPKKPLGVGPNEISC